MQKQGMVVLKILWSALFMAIIMIGFLAFQLKGEPIFEGINPAPLFLAAAMFALVLSFVIPRLMLVSAKATLPDGASFDECVRRYTVPFIVRIALAEGIATVGMAATMASDLNVSAPFILTAAARMLIAFPTEEKIRDVFSKFE
ncbi:MAG: hypothetical protein JNL01_08470 [Bdellovibrionales bacterium]|nr:hypothetical protein [Bdellovibrionales bacterium]